MATMKLAVRSGRWVHLASVHADLRELALPYMGDIYGLGNDAVQLAVSMGCAA